MGKKKKKAKSTLNPHAQIFEPEQQDRPVLQLPAGQHYDGEVHEGKPHGQGTMQYNPEVDTDFFGIHVLQYSGSWVYGKRSGYGILERHDGMKWEGTWDNDAPYGSMAGVWPGGETEHFEFTHALLGEVICTSKEDGFKQSGIMVNGKWDGPFTEMLPLEGIKYEGARRGGKWHGQRIKTVLSDGSSDVRTFEDGKQVGKQLFFSKDGKLEIEQVWE